MHVRCPQTEEILNTDQVPIQYWHLFLLYQMQSRITHWNDFTLRPKLLVDKNMMVAKAFFDNPAGSTTIPSTPISINTGLATVAPFLGHLKKTFFQSPIRSVSLTSVGFFGEHPIAK